MKKLSASWEENLHIVSQNNFIDDFFFGACLEE